MSSNNNRKVGNHRHGSSAGRSSTPLNAAANAFSPQGTKARQDLRRGSMQDSPGSRMHHGAIGVPPAGRSNTGDQSSASTMTPLQALLATGPVTVSFSTEREAPNANPHQPVFLKGVRFDPRNQNEWYNVVLPYIRTLTFTIPSTSDLHFIGAMISSPQLPQMFLGVTKLDLPNFHWFSGVAHNRSNNPYLMTATRLPELLELSFKMHTAGVTTSAWGERQMIQLEGVDPARAKLRKVMDQRDVVAKYGLGSLFTCRKLVRMRLEYIECAMTAHFTEVGNPVDVLRSIQEWIIQTFRVQSLDVAVDLVRVG